MQSVTLSLAIGVFSLSIQAQYRAPQPEKKTPRAVGVVETFKNGSRRLVPVTFFYEKKFYDAALYHATPVPFTLYSETVYEVQQFGKPLGTFTLQSASRSGDETSSAWFGNGKFKAAPDAATLAKKTVVAPVVVEDDPSKPVLHRREGSEGDKPQARPVAAKGETEEDPDRPKLHRHEGSGTAAETGEKKQASGGGDKSAGSSSPEASSAESSGQDPNRPKLHRKDDAGDGKSASTASEKGTAAKPETVASKGTGQVVAAKAELTPSDDPDHPVLRRGKPVQAQGGADLPDFKKEEPVTRQVAISDEKTGEMQPLIYVGTEAERNKLEELARELASAELRRLASQRGLVLPGSANAVSAGAKKGLAKVKASAQGALPFKDERFVPYDLDYSNYATVVYSGRYAPEATQGGAPGRSWVVTVVARENEGKLVKLYSAVSDPRELDLHPEVQLVDAVDPDGYGRAALLFREKKRDGVSWLLGRATGYELQTLIETSSR